MKLDAFVRQYRSTVVVRCALPLVLTVMLGTIAPLGFTAAFGALQLVLHLIFFAVIEAAARDASGAENALRRMTVRTALVTFLITLHACWMALVIREEAATVIVRMEATLVIIGVLMFTASQTHMSRPGYLAGVAPAIGSLVWLAIDQPTGVNIHLVLAVCLFLLAVVAMTWRQQSTDLMLRDTQIALERKNIALIATVAEAEAARAQAEAANRAKSDFLAMTSHEIRTPLNAVLGLAEALTRSPLPKRESGMAQGVVDAGALLKRLLDAMLDISRIEAGKMTLSPAPFDLRRATETLTRIWAPKAAETDVAIVLDLDGLPADCVLMADGPKIEQMLFNLVSNAVKFSPAGGQVTIRASAAPGEDAQVLAIALEILDQGPGVSPADRARIFRAFEQADAGRELGGAGLGLAICVGNLTLMGGTISVDEAPGGGALFRIAFPAVIGESAEARADVADIADLDEHRPLRVLAAEDNAGNRHVLQVLLEPLPVTLTLVENGAQAMEAMASEAFDLVLMDVNMPVLDGLSALGALRASGVKTPIWMLTANVFEEDVARYRAAGADGVLRKPIELNELFAVLSHAAEQPASRSAAA